MVTVRHGLAAALAVLAALLAALATPLRVGFLGYVAGLACAAVLALAAARAASRAHVEVWGPADLVTLTRATLACVVATLVADSLVRDAGPPVTEVRTLVGLTVVALLLDAVDGRVARRTGTVSALGARLDGEADAFLMLVLSVYVARSAGAWVVAIGAVRYVFGAAGWLLPWLRAPLPARYWRKVVTATAGIALALAAADVVGDVATYAALALASGLLAESFGRDVWWLWRHRVMDATATTSALVGVVGVVGAVGVGAVNPVAGPAVPPRRTSTGMEQV